MIDVFLHSALLPRSIGRRASWCFVFFSFAVECRVGRINGAEYFFPPQAVFFESSSPPQAVFFESSFAPQAAFFEYRVAINYCYGTSPPQAAFFEYRVAINYCDGSQQLSSFPPQAAFFEYRVAINYCYGSQQLMDQIEAHGNQCASHILDQYRIEDVLKADLQVGREKAAKEQPNLISHT